MEYKPHFDQTIKLKEGMGTVNMKLILVKQFKRLLGNYLKVKVITLDGSFINGQFRDVTIYDDGSTLRIEIKTATSISLKYFIIKNVMADLDSGYIQLDLK